MMKISKRIKEKILAYENINGTNPGVVILGNKVYELLCNETLVLGYKGEDFDPYPHQFMGYPVIVIESTDILLEVGIGGGPAIAYNKKNRTKRVSQ